MVTASVHTSHLSKDQQLALRQFTTVTDQTIEQATPLLQRCQWNIHVAIAAFFDGEPAEPVEVPTSANPRSPNASPQSHEGSLPSPTLTATDLPPGHISRQLVENAGITVDHWREQGSTGMIPSALSSGFFPTLSSSYASWLSCNPENSRDLSFSVKEEEQARKSLEPFAHLPLRYPDSIRLLRIKDTDSRKLIRCSLREFELSERPPYTALSYVWKDYGPIWRDPETKKQESTLDADLKRTIMCNGKQLRVGINLFTALSGLRKELNGRYIWIDAICIDQNDEREKSAQMVRLAKIYSGADFVFIWLGTKTPERDRSVMLMEDFPVWPKSAPGLSLVFKGGKFISPQKVLEGSVSTVLLSWASAAMCLLDAWFQRAWTIQEFVHAKSFGFYYNGYQVPTYCLENALSWLRLLSDEISSLMIDASPWWYRSTYSIFDLRARIQRGELLDLSESVLIGALRSSSMPQDQVYAILSMTESSSLKGQGLSGTGEDALVPEHGKPVEDVFIDLARRLLHGKMGLSVLSLVRSVDEAQLTGMNGKYGHSKPHKSDLYPEKFLGKEEHKWLTKAWPDLDGFRTSTFPSWVPKLSMVPGTQPYHLRGSNAFAAASSMEETFKVSPSGRILTVSAAEVDTVRFQVAVSGVDAVLDARKPYFWPKLKPYFREKLGPNSLYKHTGERRLSALWRTLLDDMWSGRHPAPSELESDFVRWLAKQTSGAKVRHELDLAYEPEPEAEATFFGSALVSTARSRAFFVTEKGYYGLGPRTVRRGDSVMVVPGTQVPYLFRPHLVKEDSWVLVGETYVHGIMHGEVLRSGLDFRLIDII